MTRDTIKFDEFSKDCRFRTYQDMKCVHDKNTQRCKVHSCSEILCPLKKSSEIEKENISVSKEKIEKDTKK